MKNSKTIVFDIIKRSKEEFKRHGLLKVYYRPREFNPSFYFVIDSECVDTEITLYWQKLIDKLDNFEGSCIGASVGTEEGLKRLLNKNLKEFTF